MPEEAREGYQSSPELVLQLYRRYGPKPGHQEHQVFVIAEQCLQALLNLVFGKGEDYPSRQQKQSHKQHQRVGVAK